MVGFLGKDIMLRDGDVQFSSSQDFRIVSDDDNLSQAIINRCLTMRGEYLISNLYGSNLHLAIGLPSNDYVVNAVKSYLFEVLNQEPRISSFTINRIEIIGRETVNIELEVIPITNTNSLNIIFPLYLNGDVL
jgi:phage baseplate assembly protein W